MGRDLSRGKGPKNMAATACSGRAAFRYDVSRKTFTSHIYKAKVCQRTGTCRDLRLHDGAPIDDLRKAVLDSKICILVLSRDYASSATYLRELARATELDKPIGEPEILSIFYDVTPLDLVLSTERYLKVLEKDEQREKDEQSQWCGPALGEVAEIEIKGWESRGDTPIEVIENTVKQVLRPNKRPLDSKLISSDGRSVRRRITWKKGQLLGKGSFGVVYEALTDGGFSFAVKEVSFVGCEKHLLSLEQEISLLSRLQHDNIVRYYGTKQDHEKLCLYLELMTKGSLKTLYKGDKLSHSQVPAYVRQILNGLKYLHDQSVAHRDIKCANLLLDASESVKLADFGLAKVIETNDNSFQGSAYWMAPEVCYSQNKGYGLAADIWSLGCTVLEMLTCQHPYPDLEGQQALWKLFNHELPPVPNSIQGDARNFILRCLQVEPDKRPSAAELLNDPFLGNTSSSFAYPHFNNVRS